MQSTRHYNGDIKTRCLLSDSLFTTDFILYILFFTGFSRWGGNFRVNVLSDRADEADTVRSTFFALRTSSWRTVARYYRLFLFRFAYRLLAHGLVSHGCTTYFPPKVGHLAEGFLINDKVAHKGVPT